jgi:hypothetical protein
MDFLRYKLADRGLKFGMDETDLEHISHINLTAKLDTTA